MSSLALVDDVAVEQLVLNAVGGKLRRSLRVEGRIVDGQIERTMDGASTLTIDLHDPQRTLLRSGVFDEQIDVLFDGVWWRSVKLAKQTDQLTLTFEDRVVALLRKNVTPRKASRSKMTRAEFALSVVRESTEFGEIPFVCPELHVTQEIADPAAPIKTEKQKITDKTRVAKKQKGLPAGAALTVKGVAATQSQRDIGQRLLDVANSLSAPHTAAVAMIESAITESTIQNLTYGDQAGLRYGGSLGVYQVIKTTADNLGIAQRDVEACAHTYLSKGFRGLGGAIELTLKHPDWSAAWVGENVMGIGEAAVNERWKAEAEVWVDAYNGGDIGGLGPPATAAVSSKTVNVPYQFQRGDTVAPTPPQLPENSWECLQRLASEVGWRCYCSGGNVYFVSETALLTAKPSATVSEQTSGVYGIDFDIDNGQPDSEVSVSCRADRWAFPPGSVIALEDCGPADGRWLVQSVSRGVFDPQASISLKRATQPLPEPAPEQTTVTVGGADATTGLGLAAIGGEPGAAGSASAAYQAAQAIDAKRYPYVWGGGHAHCGTADGGTGRDPGIGYDCSGSTCAVLAAAGMGYTLGGAADVSGTIASRWGQAGKGQQLTVYANGEHVFMVFHTAKGDQHFGTGHWGKSWGGAGFNPEMHFLTGFTARHWPGS